MKKNILIGVGIAVVLALSLLGVKTFLFDGGRPDPVPMQPSVEQSADVGQTEQSGAEGEPEQGEPAENQPAIQEVPMVTNPNAVPYSNGMASFTYDSTQLVWEEMPSDQDHGYPMTSFYMANGTEAMPRVDILPAVLEAPFQSTLTDAEWEAFAKQLILAYYTPDEQSKVALNMSNTVVKVEGDSSKMYVGFTATIEAAPDYNMSGSVRLVSKGTNASVTIATCKPGASIPQVMQDLYMSATIN